MRGRVKSRGGAGAGAPLRRSALRADFPPVLGLVARRKLAAFAALTTLKQTRRSQITKRAGARGHEPCAPRRLTGAPAPARPQLCNNRRAVRRRQRRLLTLDTACRDAQAAASTSRRLATRTARPPADSAIDP